MKTMNLLKWGQKTVVGTNQLSYYDETIYRVPVVGVVDCSKIHRALCDKYFPPYHNCFGGYCSLSSVTDNGDGTVNVRVLYHIGE